MKHLLDTLPDGAKHAMDWAAAGSVIVTVAGWLPAVAALLSITWFLVRLHDRWRYGPNVKSD